MSKQPVRDGQFIRLLPLHEEHVPELCKIGLDASIWHWIPAPVASVEHMQEYVARALAEQQRGESIPFVMQWKATGELVGCTRYGAISWPHKRVEIGWTWITPAFQGTVVNPEVKWIMLDHAFTTLDCNRVELKTDARNARSRAAMRAIGCTEEGVLRHHMVTASGHLRDTVYFSILRAEWPGVSDHLKTRIASRAAASAG